MSQFFNEYRRYKMHLQLEKAFDVVDEIAKALKGWDGNSITVTTPSGWVFTSDGECRDQIVTISTPPFNMEGSNYVDVDLMLIANIIECDEEFGWVDLDPNAWKYKAEAVFSDEDEMEVVCYRLTMQCVDWAS